MNLNETSFYDQVHEILLHYPALRWVSKREGNRGAVIGLAKIEAVKLALVDAVFLNRLRQARGQSLIFGRLNSRDSPAGWHQLYELFGGQPCLVYRQATKEKGVFDLYILVRQGLFYEGIKTNEIEVINGR